MFQYFDGLLLFCGGSLGYIFFEVAIAKLLNDVIIVRAFHDFIDGDDVLRLDLLEDFNLFEESSFEVLVRVNYMVYILLSFLFKILIAQVFFVC